MAKDEAAHKDTVPDWKDEVLNAGSLPRVDLEGGVNGWASPHGDVFSVRGTGYLTRKNKIPAGDWLLKPVGVDWLRSSGGKLDHVLARPDNRVMTALRRANASGHSLKSFVFAVNLQVPGRDHHSAVFYYATDDPIPPGSLFYRFVNEQDDAFRNARFKIVNRIVKGPWIVKATVGNYSACLLGKALSCHYLRGPNYLEIDVDIGSSALASAILHLALGYVNSVTIDMGFLVESQSEDELPERLLGAVRIAQMDMASATLVEAALPRNPSSEIIPASHKIHEKNRGEGNQGGFQWSKLSRGLSMLKHGHPPKVEAEDCAEENR